ncbi:neuropeptide FF receptor 1, gene 1 S homeolog [Xenopus laevis]|uniref:MGC83178 protein n=1 Tax=Xenopus laevis TaxID=8355 RepID=Q6NTM7_XENLA|nr:neuropeptide FF receptor 1, gene 1 S homeolog [Xenopus laevis]AAH68932.1 MGC83178 protein [Xenopus laevis]
MFILAYTFIFLMCMIGNMLVCFIVLKNRQMRTVTNMFILNLAISDLLVGIFCMPTTLVDNLITGCKNELCKERNQGQSCLQAQHQPPCCYQQYGDYCANLTS